MSPKVNRNKSNFDPIKTPEPAFRNHTACPVLEIQEEDELDCSYESAYSSDGQH